MELSEFGSQVFDVIEEFPPEKAAHVIELMVGSLRSAADGMREQLTSLPEMPAKKQAVIDFVVSNYDQAVEALN